MSAERRQRAASRPNTLGELRALLRGSEALGRGPGSALQLCLLAALRPGESLDARFEDVD